MNLPEFLQNIAVYICVIAPVLITWTTLKRNVFLNAQFKHATQFALRQLKRDRRRTYTVEASDDVLLSLHKRSVCTLHTV